MNTIKKIIKSARNVGWTTEIVPACDKTGNPETALYFKEGEEEKCSILVSETETITHVLHKLDHEIEAHGGAYTVSGESFATLYLCIANS